VRRVRAFVRSCVRAFVAFVAFAFVAFAFVAFVAFVRSRSCVRVRAFASR
jgi:hypothetical protein